MRVSKQAINQAKLMYNTRCYHARCGYRSQYS